MSPMRCHTRSSSHNFAAAVAAGSRSYTLRHRGSAHHDLSLYSMRQYLEISGFVRHHNLDQHFRQGLAHADTRTMVSLCGSFGEHHFPFDQADWKAFCRTIGGIHAPMGEDSSILSIQARRCGRSCHQNAMQVGTCDP
jgi:hypothetical protein